MGGVHNHKYMEWNGINKLCVLSRKPRQTTTSCVGWLLDVTETYKIMERFNVKLASYR
jgi:hypothetical protein